jgi:hypothetical protein
MYPPQYMMTPAPSSPDFERHRSFPKIKRESPGFDERTAFMDDPDVPMMGRQEGIVEDIADEADEDAELEALELELRVARLRAKKAKRPQK